MAAGTFATRAALLLDITLAAAGNGDSDVVMTRPFQIYDVTALCTATDASGTATAQLLRQALGAGAFTAITNTMAMTTINLLARTTTVTVAQMVLAVTDVLRVTVANAASGTANGRVFVRVNPTAIPGQS